MPMRVLCEKCSASYTLPDSRLVPGKLVQFTCRHCHNRISVAVPVESVEPEPELAPEPDAPVAEDEPAVSWFYAGKDDQPERLTHAEVAAGIASRKIRSQSLLWRRGMGEWQPAGSLPEWQTALQQVSATGTHNVAAKVLPGAENPSWKMRSSDDPNSDSAQVAMKLPTLWVSKEEPSVRSLEAQQQPAPKAPRPETQPIEEAAVVDDVPAEAAGPITGRRLKAREAAAQGNAADPAWTKWSMTVDETDRTPVEAAPGAIGAGDWRKIAIGAAVVALVALALTAWLAFRLGSVSGQLAAQKAQAAAPVPAPAPAADPATAPPTP